jgi:hypothetical protein
MTPKKLKENNTSLQSTEELQLAEELETKKAELLVLSSIQEGVASGLGASRSIHTIQVHIGEKPNTSSRMVCAIIHHPSSRGL